MVASATVQHGTKVVQQGRGVFTECDTTAVQPYKYRLYFRVHPQRSLIHKMRLHELKNTRRKVGHNKRCGQIFISLHVEGCTFFEEHWVCGGNPVPISRPIVNHRKDTKRTRAMTFLSVTAPPVATSHLCTPHSLGSPSLTWLAVLKSKKLSEIAFVFQTLSAEISRIQRQVERYPIIEALFLGELLYRRPEDTWLALGASRLFRDRSSPVRRKPLPARSGKPGYPWNVSC